MHCNWIILDTFVAAIIVLFVLPLLTFANITHHLPAPHRIIIAVNGEEIFQLR